MKSLLVVRGTHVAVAVCFVCLTGCPGPRQDGGPAGKDQVVKNQGAADRSDDQSVKASAPKATAQATDVEAAKALLDQLGGNAKYTLLPGGLLTEVVVPDGSVLSAENITLFGRLTDLEKLQLLNFRDLNDKMAAELSGLKNLGVLALTNSVIGDSTVEMIAKSFPNLTQLDLSSNTNLTNSVLKIICGIPNLERLTLVQNRFNDLGTSHLSKLENLRVLDLRGNMEAGDMTMETIAMLPKIAALKHRSTAVTDFGMEYLAESKTLTALLMQDFGVTSQAGNSLAKLGKLTQLEIFRCQGFGSDGVLALRGMKLTRLTLRDLPMVDDQGMAVFGDLPSLQRLYLHELASLSDAGLENLASLGSLELLDIWSVPQMTDATIDVIAKMPNLKTLSVRETGITDAAVDKLLALPNLQSVTLKDNGSVSDAALEKLSTRP